jgi:CheY-like chemotaxis protein
LEYLTGFTIQPSIPVQVSGSPFASALMSMQSDASGLYLSSDAVSPSSPFPSEKPADPQSSGRVSWIVLVEDNPGDVALVREALYEYGIQSELTVLFDGERAFELFDRLDRERMRCPDLVLLDLKLPKRDGHEVLEHMRASVQCAHVPVVIVTSSNAREDRDKAAKLGATRYIRKPHSLDEFIQLGAVFKDILTGTTLQ